MAAQKIKVTVTSSMEKQISEAVKLYDQNTQRHLDRVANHLRNQIIKRMKSTAKQSVGYPRGKKMHYPSKVGNPPAIDTGRLVNSIHVTRAMPFKNGDTHSSSVSTNVWYARKLEEGVGVGARPFMGEESQAFQNTEKYAEGIASDISINRTLPKAARTGKKV